MSDSNGNVDFANIHDQDMNYYQDPYVEDISISNGYPLEVGYANESMLGPISDSHVEKRANGDQFDPVINAQFNAMLDDLEDDLCFRPELRYGEDGDDIPGIGAEQCNDYNQSDYEEDCKEIVPSWYNDLLKKKVQEAKTRLNDLSQMACMVCSSTKDMIARIEKDHNTPLCKFDFPRHPPLKKPWIDYWRFNCVVRCTADSIKMEPSEEHHHTLGCEYLSLEYLNTSITTGSNHNMSITTESNNIIECEFPQHIMQTVELFQEFANVTYKDTLVRNERGKLVFNTEERPIWTFIKMKSNYKNEIQLTVAGKAIKPLLSHLKKFFEYGPGSACNVVSLYFINTRPKQKQNQVQPKLLSGCSELMDKIGPISFSFIPKINLTFSSAEIVQLSLAFIDFLAPTVETTIVDIGCNFGVLSLIMSNKCDKVIGLNTLQHEVDTAETVKLNNNIDNAMFITCAVNDVQAKCTPLVKRCMTVAMLNLATTYGKSPHVYRALRALPTIWRVVIYGTFTKEFHKLITTLMTSDDNMGDEFLPMRGCVVDKSPSVPNALDVVVLFERKSLIEPSIQFMSADGPTMNVKEDDWKPNYYEESKFDIKKENDDTTQRQFGKIDIPPSFVKLETSQPSDQSEPIIRLKDPRKLLSRSVLDNMERQKLSASTPVPSERPFVPSATGPPSILQIKKERSAEQLEHPQDYSEAIEKQKKASLPSKQLESAQTREKVELSSNDPNPVLPIDIKSFVPKSEPMGFDISSNTNISTKIKITATNFDKNSNKPISPFLLELLKSKRAVESATTTTTTTLTEISSVTVKLDKDSLSERSRLRASSSSRSSRISLPSTADEDRKRRKRRSSPATRSRNVRFRLPSYSPSPPKYSRDSPLPRRYDLSSNYSTSPPKYSRHSPSPRRQDLSSNYSTSPPKYSRHSPSPRRYRSLTPYDYSKRDRSSTPYDNSKRHRLPLSYENSKRNRSPSPYDNVKRYRSPSPYDNVNRYRSPSPYENLKRDRSPSPYENWNWRRSPSSCEKKYNEIRVWRSPSSSLSPPPFKRNRHTSRDSEKKLKRKKHSRSSKDYSKDKDKRKRRKDRERSKDTNKRDRSKETRTRNVKKEEKSDQHFDDWDIPTLSTLSNKSSNLQTRS